MRWTGRQTRNLVGLIGLVAIGGGAAEKAVDAQPVTLGCAKAVGGEGNRQVSPWALKLRADWTEVEGEWHGRWQPVGDTPGHYRANFNKRSERAAADLQITPLSSNHVTIVRTQSEGTCTYDGILNPDGWHIQGTYTCSWNPGQRLHWSAAIARGYQPAGGCDDAAAAADPRLGQVWHEQEGDWIGTWTPVEPLGDFRAGWHKGREWANANLHITITGTRVEAVRSQAEGRCTYTGTLVGNGWRARGTYHCPWTRGPALPWSATIGSGQPEN